MVLRAEGFGREDFLYAWVFFAVWNLRANIRATLLASFIYVIVAMAFFEDLQLIHGAVTTNRLFSMFSRTGKVP